MPNLQCPSTKGQLSLLLFYPHWGAEGRAPAALRDPWGPGCCEQFGPGAHTRLTRQTARSLQDAGKEAEVLSDSVGSGFLGQADRVDGALLAGGLVIVTVAEKRLWKWTGNGKMSHDQENRQLCLRPA